MSESSSLNLALPSVPQNYQSDKFRAGELDCSNAIGSATNLEFGVTGLIRDDDPYNNNRDPYIIVTLQMLVCMLGLLFR